MSCVSLLASIKNAFILNKGLIVFFFFVFNFALFSVDYFKNLPDLGSALNYSEKNFSDDRGNLCFLLKSILEYTEHFWISRTRMNEDLTVFSQEKIVQFYFHTLLLKLYLASL